VFDQAFDRLEGAGSRPFDRLRADLHRMDRTASATSCPPGYNGTYPHCVPRQRKPTGHASLHPRYMKTVTPSPTGVVPIRKPGAYPIDGKIIDPHKLPPRTIPGPHHESIPKSHGFASHHAHGSAPASAASSFKYDLRAQHEAKSDKHGIIFVGGKSSLNPQPIPPGHTASKPPPVAPIEKAGH
jgi:hypothetical protein